MILFDNSTFILNVVILILLIFCVYRGYSKGLVNQFFNMFSILAAAFSAWFLYVPLGKLINIAPKSLAPFQQTVLEGFFYEKINSYMWFIVLFIIAYIFIRFIKFAFNIVTKVPGISHLNKYFGAAFGLVNFFIMAFLMIYIISMPIFANGVSLVERSLLKPVINISNIILPSIAENISDFSGVSSLGFNPSQASVEDVENMQEYLEKNKVSMDSINEFFQEINK